jgi:uncharacterized glyoxalase superfamily protein PhnB
MATTPEAALQATLAPNLTVDDLQKSLAFFEALGFAIDERWEDDGVLNGVMLRAGDARVGLTQDDWKKGRDRRKGLGVRLFIETAQDVDALAQRAREAGITLDSEVHAAPWGGRVFEVTEPTGFVISVYSHA